MKIGSVEGTPEEIRDAFENHGLNLEDYLEKPKPQLSNVWIFLPAGLLVAALISLVLLAPLSNTVLLLLFLSGAAGICWLSASVQIKFQNTWATTFVGIGTLLMLLVAAGLIAPKETIEAIRDLKGK